MTVERRSGITPAGVQGSGRGGPQPPERCPLLPSWLATAHLPLRTRVQIRGPQRTGGPSCPLHPPLQHLVRTRVEGGPTGRGEQRQ